MAEEREDEYRESAREMVLDLLPSEYREQIIEEGAKAGTNRPDDPMWSMVGMLIDSWAAAEAARASADASAASAQELKQSFESLHQAFNNVPTEASKAVLKAGESAAGDAESSIRGKTNTEIQRINEQIGETVQQKLDTGGNTLVEKIDNRFAQAKAEIDEYKQGKVKEFKGDLQNAAYEATAAELTKARNRSFLSGVGAVLLGVVITIAGSNAWVDYGPGWFQPNTTFHHCSHGTHGHMWCRLPIQHHHQKKHNQHHH